MLWHCWLGIKQGIRPVKIERRGVGVVICLERGADCLHMFQLMPLPSTSSHASFKSRPALLLWYQHTRVVQYKKPLNRLAAADCGYDLLALFRHYQHAFKAGFIACLRNPCLNFVLEFATNPGKGRCMLFNGTVMIDLRWFGIPLP